MLSDIRPSCDLSGVFRQGERDVNAWTTKHSDVDGAFE